MGQSRLDKVTVSHSNRVGAVRQESSLVGETYGLLRRMDLARRSPVEFNAVVSVAYSCNCWSSAVMESADQSASRRIWHRPMRRFAPRVSVLASKFSLFKHVDLRTRQSGSVVCCSWRKTWCTVHGSARVSGHNSGQE